MLCPLCGSRKARRACPALRQTICPVCCGTKRLAEIACPPDCAYLASAREHPAAVVRRQQERDIARLLPTIQHLTERQYQLFFLFQSVVLRHKPEGFARLVDEDVADAAAALAATLETAARGVIYEHTAPSVVAQRLANELTALIADLRERRVTIYDGEAAIVLRAIERGAREARGAGDGHDSTYLTLISRLIQHNALDRPEPGSPDAAGAAERPSLILP